MSVIVKHNNCGFFSCCSVRLHDIINYVNINNNLPDIVDSTNQFDWYKPYNDNNDITNIYFNHYTKQPNISDINNIDFNHQYQFIDFSKLNYVSLAPFIHKYFSLSDNIISIINTFNFKYNIDYNNTCVLFYRGNDKQTEMSLCNYNDYYHYANMIIEKNPKITFLIQSDETEFIQFFTGLFPGNSVYFKDEIRHIPRQNGTVDKTFKESNYEMSRNFLAITKIMSQCKYIICGSGNCSLWIMLYRGHCNNVYQFLSSNVCNSEMCKWIIHNSKSDV